MQYRANIEPIAATIPDERQKLARYYGVHPYFTRRSANLIQTYIRRFTEDGDTVIDPFGGSGVTAVEALLLGRRGIQNDVNPLANFITRTIGDTTLASTAVLNNAFERVESACRQQVERIDSSSEAEAHELLKNIALPKNIRLPRSSDAEFFFDLFTNKQLAALAIVKRAIDEEHDTVVRDSLLLAWSAATAKLNKTFISTKGRAESRGGSSIFSIYRYKIAKEVIELPLWETFRGRFLNVLAARKEVLDARDHFNSVRKETALCVDSRENLIVLQEDASRLAETLGDGTVDYVFTDPPYGAHIAYLDLSILWNHWLGFDVSEELRAAETIVGGEKRLSEDHYKQGLAASIRSSVRLLKPDRWMSVVFQHWDITYFRAILEAAAGEGAELKAAITQEREVIWSMHKKKHSENVIGGEMILTFYKSAREGWAGNAVREGSPRLFVELLDVLLKSEVNRTEVTSQYLFNKLILLAWRSNSLSELAVTRQDFAVALRLRGWVYDDAKHLWRKGAPQKEESLFAVRNA